MLASASLRPPPPLKACRRLNPSRQTRRRRKPPRLPVCPNPSRRTRNRRRIPAIAGGEGDWCLTGPVGKPQEEGMMSTAVSLPSVTIPRCNLPVGERNHFRRLLLADFGNGAREGLVRGFGTSSNVEPAHNTTKILCPNMQWGCQSHWFADNKGLNIWCGKRCLFAVK
jgi:hypothetical protein